MTVKPKNFGWLRTSFASIVLLLSSIPLPGNAQTEIEVMHWWSRGGEKRAMQVLRDEFELRGGTWYDVPGENSISVLNTAVSRMATVSYTHLTLPTNREV